MLNINKRPMTAPPIKKTNINPNNQLNNNNLKHINNNKNDGHNIVIEQSKGKKGILERIKKPKLSPKMNDLNLVEPKKNLIRPPLKNDFKEKLIEKKMKFETQPAKNL